MSTKHEPPLKASCPLHTICALCTAQLAGRTYTLEWLTDDEIEQVALASRCLTQLFRRESDRRLRLRDGLGPLKDALAGAFSLEPNTKGGR